MIIQQLLFLSPPTLSLISLLSFRLSHFEYILHRLHVTEIYLNISEQDMPEQSVQTLIKLLLRTDWGLGFNNLPFCQHCNKTFLDVANGCQNFKVRKIFFWNKWGDQIVWVNAVQLISIIMMYWCLRSPN